MKELKRKLFHLLCLLYGGLYVYLPREGALRVMGLMGVLIILVEGFRWGFPAFNAWSWEQFGGIARKTEKDHVSGVFWTWLGCFLTMLIFVRRDVVLTAVGFLVFGDAAAALVGQSWGRHSWHAEPGKSVEGTMAFAVAAGLWGLWWLPPHVVIFSALAVAWAESRRLPWDDNFWIPILSGTCLNVLRYL